MQIRMYESVKASRVTGKFGSRALATIFLFTGGFPGGRNSLSPRRS